MGKVHRGVQTVIEVNPNILEEFDNYSLVGAERVSSRTLLELQSARFYSLLRYTPFQDIQRNSIHVIELPQKQHVQNIAPFKGKTLDDLSRECSLGDDDGVGYVLFEVCQRLINNTVVPYYIDNEAQTDVCVRPHILELNKVATVYREVGSQTDSERCKKMSAVMLNQTKSF